VRSLKSVLLIICVFGSLLGAFAQQTTVGRNGFAILTVVSGNVGGLIASETLTHQSPDGIQQTVVGPSALVTSASLLVPIGLVEESTAAIAIANPSNGSGGVNLIFTNARGRVVLSTTIVLGPRGHFSKYLNELFSAGFAPGSTAPLLLTVSSEIPVAILAFNFRGADFTSIPLTSLSTPTPVPVQPLIPATPAPALSGTVPGFGLGVATVPPVPDIPRAFTSTSEQTPSIGGGTSLVFAQTAAEGDWSSTITVGNSSAGFQQLRIDFFSGDGSVAGSLTDITIQPRGVFVFSTKAGEF